MVLELGPLGVEPTRPFRPFVSLTALSFGLFIPSACLGSSRHDPDSNLDFDCSLGYPGEGSSSSLHRFPVLRRCSGSSVLHRRL